MMLGDKLYTTKTQRKYTFYFVDSHKAKFYTYVLKVYINFQHKTKTFKKYYQTYRHYSYYGSSINLEDEHFE